MRKETILIGTVDEIHDSIMETFDNVSTLTDGTLKDHIVRVLEEGAILDTGGMGIIFFMATTDVNNNDFNDDFTVPQITRTIIGQHIRVISDAQDAKRKN